MNLTISPNPTPIVGDHTSAGGGASSRGTSTSAFAADHIVRSADDQYDASENTMGKITRAAVTLFGACEGGKVGFSTGEMIGASIGTLCAPGAGTAVGAMVGGIGGGLIGVLGGAAIGEKLGESVKDTG